ncbi:MAG: VWA domain-containing protein [Caldimicrobium sp.]
MSFLQDFDEIFFPEIRGNTLAKLALVLNLIDPKCGGALLCGFSGTGKSTLLQGFRNLATGLGIPCKYLPHGITEENLLGGIDFEETFRTGKIKEFKGLFDEVKGGFLLVENLFLLPENLLCLIFEKISDFTLIATHHLDEEGISPHFLDKIGLVAYTETLFDRERRKELFVNNGPIKKAYERALQRLFLARAFLKRVEINPVIWDRAVELALKEGAYSHRSEIFLVFSARAFSALKGEKALKEEYLTFLAPLVLAPKRRKKEEVNRETPKPRPKEEMKESPEKEKEESQKSEEKKPHREERNQRDLEFEPKEGLTLREDEVFSGESEFKERDGGGAERVFPVQIPERFVEILFKAKKAGLTGRRVRGKVLNKRGRKIGYKLTGKREELDLFETIKASLPRQKIRGFRENLIIRKEDLRFARREGKGRILLLLVVDGSGSMGVQQRMRFVKGLIFRFLTSSYQRKDKVGLIVFRKFGAELLLPPSHSSELAFRLLKDLPVGGNTPLSAGLFLALKAIKAYRAKYPEDKIVCVILTDGKANIPLRPREDPWMEIKALAQNFLRISGLTTIVIDTEQERELLRFELARDLASLLGAHYFKMEKLTEEKFIKILRVRN